MRVNHDGLRELAVRYDTAASALTTSAQPAPTGPPFQATTAAVGGGCARVTATAAELAARIVETGEKLRSAASLYAKTDGTSAGHISAVGQSMQA